MAYDDPIKVKQLLEWAASRASAGNSDTPALDIDPATAAELQRWFALPSFDQARDQGLDVPEDPDVVLARERREKVIAAVDPALVEAHRARVERCDTMIKVAPPIEIHVEDAVALMDYTMVDRGHTIGEPRELELPPELSDDLKDCTPQALLRDLHRAETDFEKVFETVDMAAAQKLDIVAMVADAFRTDWALPKDLGSSPFLEGCKLIAEARALRSSPWTDIPMPNRRVKD